MIMSILEVIGGLISLCLLIAFVAYLGGISYAFYRGCKNDNL
jgi:hypothetical protein